MLEDLHLVLIAEAIVVPILQSERAKRPDCTGRRLHFYNLNKDQKFNGLPRYTKKNRAETPCHIKIPFT